MSITTRATMASSTDKRTRAGAAPSVQFGTGCIHGRLVTRACPECDTLAKSMGDAFWREVEKCDVCTHLPLEDAIICCGMCSGKASKLAEERLHASHLGKA